MAKVGPLSTKIRFIKKMDTQDDDYGTSEENWIPVAEVWANKEDILPSRDESVMNQALEVGSMKSRFRLRWRDDIDSSMRIVVLHPLTRTMEIIGGPVEISGRKSYMEIVAEEVTTNG